MKKFIILFSAILTVLNLFGCSVNEDAHNFHLFSGYKCATSIKYPCNTIVGEGSELLAVNNDNELLAFYRKDENGFSVPAAIPYKIMDDVVAVSADGLRQTWALKSNGDLYQFGSGTYRGGKTGKSFNPVKVMDNVKYIYKNSVVTNDNEFWYYESINNPSHRKNNNNVVLGINSIEYVSTDGVLYCYYRPGGISTRADWHEVARDVVFADSFADNNPVFYITSNGTLYLFDPENGLVSRANGDTRRGTNTKITNDVKSVVPTWANTALIISKDGALSYVEKAYGGDFYDIKYITDNVNSVYYYDKGYFLILKENGDLLKQRTTTDGDRLKYPPEQLARGIKIPTARYEPLENTDKSQYGKYIGQYTASWGDIELEVHSMTNRTVEISIPKEMYNNEKIRLKNNTAKVKVNGGKYVITFENDKIRMTFLSGWKNIPAFEYEFLLTDGM